MSKELDDLIIKLGIWEDDKDNKQLDLFELGGAAGQPALTISGTGTDTISLSDLNYSIDSTVNTMLGAVGSGAAGMTWTTNGTNWPTIGSGQPGQTISIAPNSGSYQWADLSTSNHAGLKVHGDAEFEGDVKIKGKSIADTLERLEERLAILKPNPELEDRWEELKELSKRYKELEKELIEKEKMWNILKK